MEAGFGVDSGRPTLRRGRPNSHFGCREHDDDDEHAVRRSLAHCRAPRRSTAVRRAVVAAAECRRPGPRQPQSGAAAAACPSRRSRHPGEGIVRPQDRAGAGWMRAPSASIPRAVSPAAWRCRSTAPTWQVMRLSRNRNWGHPNLVQFLEQLADKAPSTGWRGLLVGDMSQPRGGPMRTGHASHQVGLDADIWLTPMPDRELTRAGARGNVRDHGRRRRPHRCRPEGLDAGASQRDQGRREGPAGRPHLRECGDQEGACAAKPAATAAGSARYSRGGATTITSTFGWSARPTTRNARRSRRGRRTTAAARNSTTGSPKPSSIPSRRRRRRSPGPGFAWPICRTPAGACCWRRRPALDRGSLLAPARHKYLVIPDELLNLER